MFCWFLYKEYVVATYGQIPYLEYNLAPSGQQQIAVPIPGHHLHVYWVTVVRCAGLHSFS